MAIARFKKQPSGHKASSSSDAGSSSHHASHKKRDDGPRWSHKVVRPIRGLEFPPGALPPALPPPRSFFNGGLGEAPRQRVIVDDGVGPTGLDREHRYWLVVRCPPRPKARGSGNASPSPSSRGNALPY